jgi:hypothetical protein
MSDAAPAAAKEKKPLFRRLRRPPTALFVTLLGIALSAWLFPALTRQWDDRQKANELKTALVAQIASASAQALIGGQDILVNRLRQISRVDAVPIRVTAPAGERRWAIASTAIETRIRAYFPGVNIAWKAYAILVDGLLLDAAYVDPETSPEAMAGELSLSDAHQPRWFHATFNSLLPLLTHPRELFPVPGNLQAALKPKNLQGYLGAYETMYLRLVAAQQLIARHLLVANPTGYSVTTQDLIHDLIP